MIRFPKHDFTPSTPSAARARAAEGSPVREVAGAVADGQISAYELSGLRSRSFSDADPTARQFAQEFTALAEEKFSAQAPAVKGWVDRLARLIAKPDPVTGVPAEGVLEAALQRLWKQPGAGTGDALVELEQRFDAGKLTVLEAVVEATALDLDTRGRALTHLATKVKNDGEAKILIAAARTNGADRLSVNRQGPVLPLERQGELAMALAANHAVTLDVVVDAAEPLNADRVGRDATALWQYAEVLHTLLESRPGAQTAQALAPRLGLVWATDTTRHLVPLAEALLRNGAGLTEIIKNFPGAVTNAGLLANSPPALAQLIGAHARTARGADADAVAQAIHFLGDFGAEQRIISEMTEGAATVPQVLEAIANCGTTVDGFSWFGRKRVDRVATYVEMVMRLYQRPHLTAEEQLSIHQAVRRESGMVREELEARSVESLIGLRTLPKEQLHQMIIAFHDGARVSALRDLLNAAYP